MMLGSTNFGVSNHDATSVGVAPDLRSTIHSTGASYDQLAIQQLGGV